MLIQRTPNYPSRPDYTTPDGIEQWLQVAQAVSAVATCIYCQRPINAATSEICCLPKMILAYQQLLHQLREKPSTVEGISKGERRQDIVQPPLHLSNDPKENNRLYQWCKAWGIVLEGVAPFCQGQLGESDPHMNHPAHSLSSLPTGGKIYLTSPEEGGASFWMMASQETFNAVIFLGAPEVLWNRLGKEIHVEITHLPGSSLSRFRADLYHPPMGHIAKPVFIRSLTVYQIDKMDQETLLALGSENLPLDLSFVSRSKPDDLGSLIRFHVITQLAALPGHFSLDLFRLDSCLKELYPELGSHPDPINKLLEKISRLPPHLRPLLFHGIQLNKTETPFCSPDPAAPQVLNQTMRSHPRWLNYESLKWDPVWEDRTRAKGYGPYPDNRFLCQGKDYPRPNVFWMHEPEGDFNHLRARCRPYHSPTDAVRKINERAIDVIIQIGSHGEENPWPHQIEVIQMDVAPLVDDPKWKALTGRRVMVVFRETVEPFINASVIPTGHLTTQFPITPEELTIASLNPRACPELNNKYPTTKEFRLMVQDSKAKIIVSVGEKRELPLDGLDLTVISIRDLADTDAVIEALEKLIDIRGPEPVIVLSKTGSVVFVAADLIFQIASLRAEFGKEWSLDLVALLKWLSLPPYGRPITMYKPTYEQLVKLIERHKDPEEVPPKNLS